MLFFFFSSVVETDVAVLKDKKSQGFHWAASEKHQAKLATV